MNAPLIREFRLSPPGGGHGVSCDADGAFVDSVPLLKRSQAGGQEFWVPRDSDELSAALGAHYGLPIDVSSKALGLNAIARALNSSDVARAQIVTLHLEFPEFPAPAQLARSASPANELEKFVRELHWSGLLGKVWEPDDHPRWPAGAPDSQGGRFAPRDESDGAQGSQFEASSGLLSGSESGPFGRGNDNAEGQNGSLIEVSANLRKGPICRDAAIAGCIAGITAATPEGAGAACAVTGPACRAGAAVGGAVTAIGSCLATGALAYGACHSINPANPDRPSDRAIRDQCRQYCSQFVGRPEREGTWGTNTWDYFKCLNECIEEKRAYWGD